ncbi:hypothetical protein LINGRAHAP2_LOCUS24519 [Linum grandiflorum]
MYDSQLAAYGVIVSDAHGEVLDGRVAVFPCSSSFSIEARAVLVAVEIAVLLDIPVSVYSDCLSLVRSLNGDLKASHWDGTATTASIYQLLRDAPHVELLFIPRKNNRRANWVARNTVVGSLPQNWLELLPDLGL